VVDTDRLRCLFLFSLILLPTTNARVQARKQAVNTTALRLFLSSRKLLYLMGKCRRPCGLLTSINRRSAD